MSKNGGLKGMQYTKKSFSTMGDGDDIKPSVMSDEERERLFKEADTIKGNGKIIIYRKKHKVVPFGDRILVRRRRIGNKLGDAKIIIASDNTSDRPTDLADVVYVAEHSFADGELISNAEQIIEGLMAEAKKGNAGALDSLMEFRKFLNMKSIKKGDAVFISKFIGTDFHDNEGGGTLTLMHAEDVIGLVVNDG